MKKTLKRILIFIIVFSIFIAAVAFDSYINIDVTHYDIKSDKLTKNYKIMLLTDLHNRDVTDKIYDIYKNENPDFIVMSGDMTNERIENGYTHFFELCNKLKDKPIYYVFGNHEENMTDERQNKYIKEVEDKTNVTLLNNKVLELEDNFVIYGFSHQVKYYLASTKEKLDEQYIKDRIGDIDKSKYNLLISHDPLLYDLYSNIGYDSVLSGHVHGGVINIPFVGGLLSPDFTFFPKYYKGDNVFDKTHVVISRGLGFGYMMPIRLFNRGEVVIINLMKNE